MLKTVDIINAVCDKIKVTRRNPRKPEFSKRELLYLWSYISLERRPDDLKKPEKRRGK